MRKRVAVTGASGFVGRHVLAEFARIGTEVVAVTRNGGSLRDLPATIRVVEMDIESSGDGCFDRLGRPDVLLHLAWGGLPNYDSMRHFECELPRQYRFLKKLVMEGLPSLLVTGTCLEYGMQSGPLSEENAVSPATPYALAKDALRRQLEFLRKAHPFDLTWARLFYMYGKGQPETSLYPAFSKALERGDSAFNMSGGEQLRDYLPAAEVARLIVQLALEGNGLGTVNVCSGRPVSVRGVVEKWLDEEKSCMQLNLGHYPYPDYEPMAFWGDTAKLQSFLRSIT